MPLSACVRLRLNFTVAVSSYNFLVANVERKSRTRYEEVGDNLQTCYEEVTSRKPKPLLPDRSGGEACYLRFPC